LAPLSNATPLGAILRAGLIALAASLAGLVVIVVNHEALSDRVWWLALIIAEGAFLSALTVALPLLWLTERWPKWLRGPLAATLTAVGFVPATMFAFAVKIRLLDGRIEDDLLASFDLIEIGWSMFGAMGLFTPRGLVYLVPWPLAAVFLASLLCFWRWPLPARS
jgi:hypothetical protein